MIFVFLCNWIQVQSPQNLAGLALWRMWPMVGSLIKTTFGTGLSDLLKG